MNRGFVVGRVFRGNESVSGAVAIVASIMSADGWIGIGGQNKNISSTNSDGQFSIPFAWSGADIGKAHSGLSILVGAYVENKGSGGGVWLETGRTSVNGYLFKDLEALMGVPFNDFWQSIKDKNVPGLLDFTKDFIQGYRKFTDYPFYKTGVWTSESWMILAGANIYIK